MRMELSAMLKIMELFLIPSFRFRLSNNNKTVIYQLLNFLSLEISSLWLRFHWSFLVIIFSSPFFILRFECWFSIGFIPTVFSWFVRSSTSSSASGSTTFTSLVSTLLVLSLSLLRSFIIVLILIGLTWRFLGWCFTFNCRSCLSFTLCYLWSWKKLRG